jgi:hypothetical protein
VRGEGTKLGEGETILSYVRGTHNKLGERERKVRLGQDSLPNRAETSGKLAESSGKWRRCFTCTPKIIDEAPLVFTRLTNCKVFLVCFFWSGFNDVGLLRHLLSKIICNSMDLSEVEAPRVSTRMALFCKAI